jgi:preprotein translocase subunit SecB
MQFALERVYALRQRCEPAQVPQDLPEKPEVEFGWNWRILEPAVFDVAISVTIKPWGARPDDITASVVGVFRYKSGEGSGLKFQTFVRENAPAILMPYAREIISSLTSRSYHGPFYLPPINVQRALENIIAQGGFGDHQVASNPELAALFGISESTTDSAPKTLSSGIGS